MREGDAASGRAGAGEHFEEKEGGVTAHVAAGLADGGERRVIGGGELDVVEAGDREVLRDPKSGNFGGLDTATARPLAIAGPDCPTF